MINIEILDDGVVLHAPYHPELPKKARACGGSFKDGLWRFDLRSCEDVKKLALEIYGYSTGCDYCDVLVKLDPDEQLVAPKGAIYLAGRQLARATGRDSGAFIGEGVVVKSGGFDSGGSFKNWVTKSEPGTVFEFRDLPVYAFENATKMFGWDDEAIAEFIRIERSDMVARDLALKEKELLLERLKVLNAIIGK